MFSLSIGKKGQNSRLAARLLGWNINIDKYVPEAGPRELTMQEQIQQAVELFKQTLGVDEAVAQALIGSGYHSVDGLREATLEDLQEVEGITPAEAERIFHATRQ